MYRFNLIKLNENETINQCKSIFARIIRANIAINVQYIKV